MRRFRVTTRTMMILVAVVAVGTFSVIEGRRLLGWRRFYLALAHENARWLKNFESVLAQVKSTAPQDRARLEEEARWWADAARRNYADKGEAVQVRIRAKSVANRLARVGEGERKLATYIEHYRKNQEKWEHAAWRPWLTVAPDPPRPR